MSDDIRERVRRLVELATHPTANEGESRNAAVVACRLIKEHKLLEVAPIRHVPMRGARHAGFVVNDMQAAMDELFGQVHRSRPARPPPQHTVEGDKPRITKDPAARTFILGSPATCAGCNDPIRVRTMVIVSHRSVWHPDCYRAATE